MAPRVGFASPCSRDALFLNQIKNLEEIGAVGSNPTFPKNQKPKTPFGRLDF